MVHGRLAFFGGMLASAALVCAGTALVASGAAAINQVHEHDTDRLMLRTRLRPVADGRMSRLEGALIATLMTVAGLAILGGHGYAAMDGGSMESRVALSDPFDAGMTLESDFLHFRGLEDLVTDTHFSARSRLGRLLAFVARVRGETGNARVFGIGVDERTALLVGADGVGRLAEGSAGAAWVVLPPAQVRAPERGRALSIEGWRLMRMNGASRIDLATRSVDKPDAQATISLVGGKLTGPSIAAPILQRAVTPPDES